MQFQCQPIALFAKSDLAADTCAQNNLGFASGGFFLQRLGRVVRDVEHRLDELLAVAAKLGNRGVVVAHHPQALGKLSQDQAAHPLAHFVDVDIAHHMRASVRRQQAINQQLQTVGLVDDDLGVLDQVFVFNFHLQQLRCTTNAPQRVFDFVRQVANQFFVGLGLVDQALFSVLTRLLLQWQQFDQHLARTLGGCDDHMHWQIFLCRAQQHRVVAHGRKGVAVRALQGLDESFRVDKALRELGAFDVAS